ncbi:MAG: DotU family type IV/VI secretion system protein [Desulfobacteraceae bacterium]|nr:DotU family type IV/VI secretion system protein [Desulfobacteraceae bacterium]MBC2754365.1 DotU family type IV/VI secretion system protein [Desulfobacteraceae bacterium]
MRLIDCFVDIMVYVSYLVGSGLVGSGLVKPGDGNQIAYEKARADINRLIKESDRFLEEETVSRADFDLARFGVFAWVDEAVMSSSWEGRNQWQRELLQRQYYDTVDAGELFFDRLNSIGLHQRDVREVYYICLAKGFTGQFCNAGDEILLEGLKNENLKILTGSSVGVPSIDNRELFPEAYPIKSDETVPPKTGKRISFLTVFCLVAPVILYSGLFLIYRFVLSNIGETIISTVP